MKRWPSIGLIFCFTFIMVGEIDFRWLPHQHRLEYQVDNNLLWRLAPNQQGFEWLAQMSQKSPPIHINSLGYRGQEIGLYQSSTAKILAVGSSSTLGTGVAEGLVWHQLLQRELNAIGYDVTLFNGANPGWGPFQHASFLEQEITKIQPDMLLVFINHQDLQFKPKSNTQKQHYLEQAKKRKELLDISPFLTYCLRKIESFVRPVLHSISGMFETSKNDQNYSMDIQPLFDLHTPYRQHMIQLSQYHQIPLVFFIPNLFNNAQSMKLEQFLKYLTKDHPLVTVHALISTESLSPNETTLLEQHYLIANDGHPNAAYHQAMADDLLVLFINSQLTAYFSASPSLTLKSDLTETS